jgi:hypothetical protein
MKDYVIQYTARKTWSVFHRDFGFIGEFATFDDVERFIQFN